MEFAPVVAENGDNLSSFSATIVASVDKALVALVISAHHYAEKV